MRSGRKHDPVSREVLRALARLKDDAARRRYLRRHPQLFRKSVVLYLNDFLRGQLRADPHRAVALSETTVAIARRVRSPEALARSLRSRANALYMVGDNQRALEFHGQAVRILRRIGDAKEEARSLIPSIQPLILLGEYDRAFETAAAAKAILERLGDRQRLGHLEINVGNIYHRQDGLEEGLACYERAIELLRARREKCKKKRRRSRFGALLSGPVGNLSRTESKRRCPVRRAPGLRTFSKARDGIRRSKMRGKRSDGPEPARTRASRAGTIRSSARDVCH